MANKQVKELLKAAEELLEHAKPMILAALKASALRPRPVARIEVRSAKRDLVTA
jgi:hypothetical protein